jgi:hypothetical protein
MDTPDASVRWDLVDAVGRSPLLNPAQLEPGIDLASVEQTLLGDLTLLAADRERLLNAARELAVVYRRIERTRAE